MFVLENLHHTYGQDTVLDLDRLEAAQGEQWLVLGMSGSGKSTLLHILGGVLRPTQGRVVVAGQELGALRGSALDRFRGQHIGLIFQQMHLLRTLSVEDNLLLTQYLAGLPQNRARVREVLASLDLHDKAQALPETLSLGQQQRVTIARAVLNRPQLILADEPTSALDDVRALQVLDLLKAQAAAYQATLVIATHDQRVKDQVEHHLTLTAGRLTPA